ncbi:hypothetical protein DFQ59_101318 [Thioalbus denitrificans]|uniref:Uncharacterized protein n=1 Tax=Thioalbus denitrificans TaxID=547122 RepID=A0A369CGH3_9GAMM|nr:hypothetical protein DFQ59_101318 [Thioalbus denitrificans]
MNDECCVECRPHRFLRGGASIRQHHDNAVSAWNQSEIEPMALPSGHLLFRSRIAGGRLSRHFHLSPPKRDDLRLCR